MYKLIRNLLFLFDAEAIHEFSTKSIKFFNLIPLSSLMMRKYYLVSDKSLEREVFGIKFKNPVGLAAGFDKNAEYYDEFSNFGFGFIEIGTVTPLPQPGNPKKRIFRLVENKSMINRLGFNNKGLKEVANNLKKERDIIVGANIGKNSFTDNKEGYKDYLKCLSNLYDYVDYFAVNISSPNTKDLRKLHNKDLLKPLLQKLVEYNQRQNKKKPILLKISPDLTNNQLNDIISIILDLEIDGVIATNTSISREGITSVYKNEKGGLSGKLLNKKSNEIIRYLRKNLAKDFPIIGVGGIMSPEDAIEKINCGADLIQIYTGFIYQGPSLIKKINKLLLK